SYACEIRDAIRRDIFLWVSHFVEQLLLDRSYRNPPTRSLVLGDRKGTVGIGLDNRVADISNVGNCIPIDQTISAGALRPTLDGVASYCSRRQPIPIISRPSELVNHRSKGKTGIGCTACYDDPGARVQRLRDRAASEVHIRALHERQHRLKRLAGIEVLEISPSFDVIIEPVHDVIAGDYAHF